MEQEVKARLDRGELDRTLGLLYGEDITGRDLFDTGLMGLLTPRPSRIIGEFRVRYSRSPEEATDWYYAFSQDVNYIRRDRIARDRKWVAPTEYGDLDITINLSKKGGKKWQCKASPSAGWRAGNTASPPTRGKTPSTAGASLLWGCPPL